MLVAVHHLAEALQALVGARDGEPRREDGLDERGWCRRPLARGDGRGRRAGRVAVLADEGDKVRRVGERAVGRRLRVARRAVAIHVALADERALSSSVADCGEELGALVVQGAVQAGGRRPAVDEAIDDVLVGAAGVGDVGKLLRKDPESACRRSRSGFEEGDAPWPRPGT